MPEAPGLDPTVYRRRLRHELRRAREFAGYSQRDVALAMDWSLSKLLRIETGSVSITTNDLRILLEHYGVTDPAQVEALREMARAARERSWWQVYREVAPPEYLSLLGFESAASVIRSFDPLLVPELLQTEDYAREILTAVRRTTDQVVVDSLVDLQVRRQELFVRRVPPSFHFVLDEAVIQRQIGGREVMRGQLQRLREVADLPNVTVRIAPFHAGAYPMRVPYTLFEFPDSEDEDLLAIEDPLGNRVIREPPSEELDAPNPITYLERFFQLEQITTRDETSRLLNAALDRLQVGDFYDSPGSPLLRPEVGHVTAAPPGPDPAAEDEPPWITAPGPSEPPR